MKKTLRNNKSLVIIGIIILVVAISSYKSGFLSRLQDNKVIPSQTGVQTEEEEEEFHVGYEEPGTEHKNIEVELSSDGFSPSKITVKEHDTIIFENKDTIDHEIVSDAPAKDSQEIYKTVVLKPGHFSGVTFPWDNMTITFTNKQNPSQIIIVTVVE